MGFFYGRTPYKVLRPEHAAVLGAGLYVELLSRKSRPGILRGNDAAASAQDGTPPGLQRLEVREVMPWYIVPGSNSAHGATAAEQSHSTGCGAAGVVARPTFFSNGRTRTSTLQRGCRVSAARGSCSAACFWPPPCDFFKHQCHILWGCREAYSQ